jgi:hypothetical protein
MSETPGSGSDPDDRDGAPPLDGTYTAVVDRYEDIDDVQVAVLVVEADGTDVAEYLVERSTLSEDCRSVDTVLEVTFSGDKPTAFRARPEETSDRKSDAQSRFDRLSRRRRSDDDT